jgi:hypothetical protein
MRILAICLRLFLPIGIGVTTARARAEPEWIVAQPSDELRFTDLSFSLGFDGGYGFGLTPGLQMGIPVVNGGLIPAINDSFYLEPGLLLSVRMRTNDRDLLWVIPELGPRWNFHLTPSWDAFAAIKLGWAIGPEGDFWIRGVIGTLWWFAPGWALRLETAYGALVGAGGTLGLSYRFL